MDALLLVDLQNDFMPGGALAVRDGDVVVPIANALLPRFEIRIATQDWHPQHHGSFITAHPGRAVGDVTTLGGLQQVIWPVHCVEGTPGAELHADLDTDRLTAVVRKGTDPTIDSYSGFFDNDHRKATDLENMLRHLKVTRVFIMGLATDYCVKFTALDARQLGFDTTLITDGCRGVDLTAGDADKAVREMVDAGVTLSTSTDITQRRSSHGE